MEYDLIWKRIWKQNTLQFFKNRIHNNNVDAD